MKRYHCDYCNTSTSTPLNDDDMCTLCEAQFEEKVKNRTQWTCDQTLCTTPVTCATHKQCCKVKHAEKAE